ncbi:MAG: hypothetical protein JWP63_5701, partial [Candidatus Solibacter sp.]|nr:hypothetical protein [Candidatus Solibacter sp.]
RSRNSEVAQTFSRRIRAQFGSHGLNPQRHLEVLTLHGQLPIEARAAAPQCQTQVFRGDVLSFRLLALHFGACAGEDFGEALDYGSGRKPSWRRPKGLDPRRLGLWDGHVPDRRNLARGGQPMELLL